MLETYMNKIEQQKQTIEHLIERKGYKDAAEVADAAYETLFEAHNYLMDDLRMTIHLQGTKSVLKEKKSIIRKIRFLLEEYQQLCIYLKEQSRFSNNQNNDKGGTQ